MSDPRQAWIILEEISGRILAGNDAADTFYGQFDNAMTTIQNYLSTIITNTNDIKEGVYGLYSLEESNHAELMTLLNDMNGRIDGINAGVDTLNNNSSLNAQNLQNLIIGGVGACCDDITPITGTPDAMCQKAQQLIAGMYSFTLFVADATSGGVLPTVADVQRAFTVLDADGIPTVLISTTDANKVVAAIAAVGAGSMEMIQDLSGDTDLNAAIKAILGVASNSTQAYNAVQSIDPDDRSQSPAIVKAYLSFFAQSVINALWDTTPIFTGEGYDDDCGGPPPFDGSGFKPVSFLIPQDGTDTFDTIGSTIDMQNGGSGNMLPTPYPVNGELVHAWLCFNQTDNEDTAIALGTIDGDLGSVFTTINPGEDNTFIMPNQRFLYAFGYHRAAETGTGTAWINFAWEGSDASLNCPE